MDSKVVIVTGASRGIGRAIAKYLLCNNIKVVLVARTQSSLENLQGQNQDNVQIVVGDVTTKDVASRAHSLAIDTWGRLDGLSLNHGTLEPVSRVGLTHTEEWQKCFDINLFSCIDMIQECLPSLRTNSGKIILCSSGASVKAYPGWGPYGASKASLNHLATTLAIEEPNITTLSIRPGVVDTDMQRSLREEHSSRMGADMAQFFANLKTDGKLLRPEQPGNVMARLVSDAPKELNGQFINWNDERLSKFQD